MIAKGLFLAKDPNRISAIILHDHGVDKTGIRTTAQLV